MVKQFLTFVMFALVTLPLAAQIKVTGKVTDEAKTPLPGANVMIHGTSKGVTTDPDGNYSIDTKRGDVLDFSFLGFKLQSKKVTGGG